MFIFLEGNLDTARYSLRQSIFWVMFWFREHILTQHKHPASLVTAVA